MDWKLSFFVLSADRFSRCLLVMYDVRYKRQSHWLAEILRYYSCRQKSCVAKACSKKQASTQPLPYKPVLPVCVRIRFSVLWFHSYSILSSKFLLPGHLLSCSMFIFFFSFSSRMIVKSDQHNRQYCLLWSPPLLPGTREEALQETHNPLACTDYLT